MQSDWQNVGPTDIYTLELRWWSFSWADLAVTESSFVHSGTDSWLQSSSKAHLALSPKTDVRTQAMKTKRADTHTHFDIMGAFIYFPIFETLLSLPSLCLFNYVTVKTFLFYITTMYMTFRLLQKH